MARSGEVGARHLAMRIVAKYLVESIRHRIVSLTLKLVSRVTTYPARPAHAAFGHETNFAK